MHSLVQAMTSVSTPAHLRIQTDWLAPGEPPVKKTASCMGFPGGAWGEPLHLARQAFKRNGQNGSTMHREMNPFQAVKIGDRPTDVDDNGNRKVVVGK